MKFWSFKKGQNILSNWQKTVDLKPIENLVLQSIKTLKSLRSSEPSTSPFGPPRGTMRFPYTMGAKIVQFPYKFYYQNNWLFRYYPWGVLASLPIFWYCSKLSNSDSNKAKWAEIRRLEEEEALHKFD